MPHIKTWQPGGLYRRFIGKIDGEEILASNLGLHTDPNFHNIKYIINDFSEITDHSISEMDTEIFAITDEIISRTKGHVKIALITKQQPDYELAKNYCALMKNTLFKCDVFNSIDDAQGWINGNK